MKLFELLETAIKTQDIIINESSQFCMVYSERYQCFVWCDRSGKAKKNILDMSGYDRVLLSPKLLTKEKWYLLECNKYKLDKIKEVSNKSREETYIQKRYTELQEKCNIGKILEDYYKLGAASANGCVMYMLDNDFNKSDIKKMLIKQFEGDTQYKSDVYNICGELYENIK